MSSYVVQRPTQALWVEDDFYVPASQAQHTPTVSEQVAVNTGLLNAEGHPIMRMPLPIGFGRMEEW